MIRIFTLRRRIKQLLKHETDVLEAFRRQKGYIALSDAKNQAKYMILIEKQENKINILKSLLKLDNF